MARLYRVFWSTVPHYGRTFTSWREAKRQHIADCLHLLGIIDPEAFPACRQCVRDYIASVRRMRHAPNEPIQSPNHLYSWQQAMLHVWKE